MADTGERIMIRVVEKLLSEADYADQHYDEGVSADTAREAAKLLETLVSTVEKCRDKFLHYEQLHRLKCTSEGDEKADRNRDLADMCDTALAAARGGQPKKENDNAQETEI